MKKFLFTTLCASCVSLSTLFAAGIDVKTAKVEFEGYKTPDMVGTKGGFTKAQFTLGKDSSTLSAQLKGAKAVFSPADIDMGDEIITANIVDTFFKVLNSKANFTVTFKDVLEANNKGSINAVVMIGKESTTIPLDYSIQDGKFVAKGRFSLDNFKNTPQALKKLSEVAPGHLDLSWPLVDVTFSANMQK